jgi:hypothetical protein
MKQAVHESMINEEGLWVRLDTEQGLSQTATAYDTGMYLWSGLPDAQQAARAADALGSGEISPVQNPFAAFFPAQGLFAMGRDTQAMAFVRKYWHGMIQRGAGTYWEYFSTGWPETRVYPPLGNSMCHGWGSAPLFIFARYILGAAPEKPGFASVRFEPRLCGLKHAQGTVPVPGGEVTVSWHAENGLFTGTVGIPAGRPLTVSLPAGSADIRADGELQETEPGVHKRREFILQSPEQTTEITCTLTLQER